jgi:hypothetical protein
MNLKLRKFIQRQPEEEKNRAAQILDLTTKMLKEGRTDLALKYLMHNKRKIENEPKIGFFKSLLKKFR